MLAIIIKTACYYYKDISTIHIHGLVGREGHTRKEAQSVNQCH